jgi:1-acyl-sn-glycerol-3-phosphate acyltransferase
MPAAQFFRQWTRIIRFALHLARGLLIEAFVFPLQGEDKRKREIQRWSQQLLALLAVRLCVHGAPADRTQPLMFVANHVSWLDIFAINAIVPARFVAKSEVRRWPLVGWLCEKAGTIFIERARRHDTARINHAIGDALGAGDVFVVFPEGTTTDGSTVLKFHASLLEPALESGAAVQPVALRYECADGALCTEAAYDGDKSAWDTLVGMTSEREIVARVWFLQPLAPHARHRRELAQAARDAILLRLQPPPSGNRTDRLAGLRAEAH